VTLNLYSNSGGLPGSILATLTQVGTIPTSPGLVAFNYSGPTVQLASGAPILAFRTPNGPEFAGLVAVIEHRRRRACRLFLWAHRAVGAVHPLAAHSRLRGGRGRGDGGARAIYLDFDDDRLLRTWIWGHISDAADSVPKGPRASFEA
jgi:hypothetical protein